MTLITLGTVAAGLYLIEKMDQVIKLSAPNILVIVMAGVLGNWLLIWRMGPQELLSRVFMAVILGCLLLACVTDLAICQVHNFVWWIGGAAAGLLLWAELRGAPAAVSNVLPELFAFCVIQIVLFGRLYGRADCYAFCVCAGALAGLGLGFMEFLQHMILAFLLLTVVQAFRKNISLKGNLKKPVPFLPYITTAFYLLLPCEWHGLIHMIFNKIE